MSSSANWRPDVKPPDGQHVPYQLQRAIAEEFGEYDGTMIESIRLGSTEALWLKGFASAHSDSDVREVAEAMVRAIYEHGAIVVNITR